MKKLCLYFLLVFLSVNIFAQTKDYTKYVNPFIGTGGHGHTFPGATVPFGMVQLSPDTRIDNWDGSSGYHYSDNEIFGFSHTHLSGTGIPDYCDVLFLPTLQTAFNTNGIKATFSHENEKAEPGFYSVKLDDGILAELTSTARVGVHRYTFPDSDKGNIILDLKWRDKVLDSEIKIIGKNRIEGYRRSSSWAKDQIVYFSAEFSEPFEITIAGGEFNQEKGNLKEKSIQAITSFKNLKNRQVLVKVGISAVSVENARENLKTEVPAWDFEKVRADAKKAWNKELSKIEVTDDNQDNLTIFYTSLYHTMIAPNIFQDVNGQYRGLDRKVHTAPKDTNYTIFSLWDTFRAAHPLYTIIDEKRTVDFINTFIRQYEQGGRLPVWTLWDEETDTMIGYHSVSVIADAMAKGIKGFDYEKAYEAAKHSAELDHFGLEAYKRRGYISMEDENEGVSKTLEYAYNDYCISRMAKILLFEEPKKSKIQKKTPKPRIDSKGVAHLSIGAEKQKIQEEFVYYLKRSQYYKNLFDAETGFMRPRQNGGFVSPFQPSEVTFHFTEGNSWVYSFFVPHDVSGLIDLYGGKDNFTKRLNELFTTEEKLSGRFQPDITGLIGQYAHGNEPSHHIAYLFNYVGQPWRTQELIYKINTEFYKNAPDGLIGNEDCGQMSAWFILSSLGFYQVNPSVPSYDIGTPLFKEAKIHLENGKTFTVKTKNLSPTNAYIKSIKLNGKDYRKTFFNHSEIINGSIVEFEMTDKPVENWFTEFSSSKVPNTLIAVPVISAKDRVFKTSTEVSIKSSSKDAKILYSIDGNEPNLEYKKPFTVDKTAIVKAVSVNAKGEKSFVVESKLNKIPHDWTVSIASKYNQQYTGGGDIGLIDGIRGTVNFASGEWQGYQGQDFIATIDMQRETEIKEVGAGFLSAQRSWIFMPRSVEFEVSDDNVNFKKVAEIKIDFPEEEMTHIIKDYMKNITPTKARYVRIKAINFGKLQAWHPGAGFEAFIFIDEVFIN